MEKLTGKQADMVAQVAATLAIEGMSLTKEDYRNLAEVASGRKTEEEMARILVEQCRERDEDMPDCRNYRYRDKPKGEWCREGLDTPLCRYGDRCPFYEKCEDGWELEERHYPDEE